MGLTLLNFFFAPLSFLYRALIALRHFAYDKKIFSTHTLPIPVISIGNLIAGGTGKTPLVHLLASRLEQQNISFAILSRGYRSAIEKTNQSTPISIGQGPLFSPFECGDEPYFLAKKTKASIWVGPDRVASGRAALTQGARCLLLDDGMQHRRIGRDFEIILLDGVDPFSKGRFLPWGLLRDSPKRLKTATLIVANHVRDIVHHRSLQKQIAPFTKAPLISVCVEVINASLFPPRKAALFCGIGQPKRFLQTARDLNQQIVDTLIVRDHGSLTQKELQIFARTSREKGAEVLLCTEKDYVKLPSIDQIALPILPIEIRLQMIAGQEHWEHLIKNIEDKVIK